MKEKIKYFLGKMRAIRFGIRAGKNVYIGKKCSIKGKKNIRMNDNVILRPEVQLWTDNGKIKIGDRSEIGQRSRVSIANLCVIEEQVLISPNVYITDCDHAYYDIKVPIMDQGICQRNQKVVIGRGSFIGINSVIIGNVTIGKGSVIGANSVVTQDIPDFCVACGCPAKIIKKYDLIEEKWKKITLIK